MVYRLEENIIKIENVDFVYKSHSDEFHDTKALSGIGLNIDEGKFIVILGRNGSGKSTFSRLLNALLLPTNGAVTIKGLNTKEEKNLWEIRRTAGMVFQNPDNQIIGTIVEEDVAFGVENLGVETSEIRKRVDYALNIVGADEFKKHAPHLLSGGQKQRVAIAGILAMKPECIILDEATSMLDPIGRKEVIDLLRRLNKDEKITVIHITHHMDEATFADRVVVFNDGKIALDGSPREVFSNVNRIKELGMEVPQVTELFYELNSEGLNLPLNILNVEEAFQELKEIIKV